MQNINDIEIAAERIRRMEELYDMVRTAFSDDPSLLRKKKSLKAALIILTDYYDKGLWLRDYTLDEEGAFPPELKRGVLSQDGLYNLLCEIETLKNNK